MIYTKSNTISGNYAYDFCFPYIKLGNVSMSNLYSGSLSIPYVKEMLIKRNYQSSWHISSPGYATGVSNTGYVSRGVNALYDGGVPSKPNSIDAITGKSDINNYANAWRGAGNIEYKDHCFSFLANATYENFELKFGIVHSNELNWPSNYSEYGFTFHTGNAAGISGCYGQARSWDGTFLGCAFDSGVSMIIVGEPDSISFELQYLLYTGSINNVPFDIFNNYNWVALSGSRIVSSCDKVKLGTVTEAYYTGSITVPVYFCYAHLNYHPLNDGNVRNGYEFYCPRINANFTSSASSIHIINYWKSFSIYR